MQSGLAWATAAIFRSPMPSSESEPDVPPRRWSARIYRLGEEPGDDLSAVTTAEERLAMVAELSRRMWSLTGRPAPVYQRAGIPARLVQRA
jgi:hypothetical protein